VKVEAGVVAKEVEEKTGINNRCPGSMYVHLCFPDAAT
jgi:hypothetical protein